MPFVPGPHVLSHVLRVMFCMKYDLYFDASLLECHVLTAKFR